MKFFSSALRFGVWGLFAATLGTAAFFGATVRGANQNDASAAFIDSDTAAVVRVDLAALDIDALSNVCVQTFAQTLRQQGFDDASVVKTAREFKKTLDAVKDVVRPQLAQIRENFGLQEAFVVGQKVDVGASYRVVLPVPSVKQAGVKPLLAFAPFDVQETPNALILIPKVDGAADFYADFQPGVNSRVDEFLQETAGATVQIYFDNFGLRSYFDSENAPQEVCDFLKTAPEEIGRAIATFDQFFIDATGTIDLNTLSVALRLNFTSAKHADEVLAGLKKLSEVGAEALEKSIVESAKGDDAKRLTEFNVPGLTREVARGLLGSALPKRDGSALVFEGKIDAKSTLGNPAVAGIVAIGAALFVPAVQAARESAVQIRAANSTETGADSDDSDNDEIHFEAK